LYHVPFLFKKAIWKPCKGLFAGQAGLLVTLPVTCVPLGSDATVTAIISKNNTILRISLQCRLS